MEQTNDAIKYAVQAIVDHHVAQADDWPCHSCQPAAARAMSRRLFDWLLEAVAEARAEFGSDVEKRLAA